MFDLHYGLERLAIDDDKLVACFHRYLKLESQQITRAMAEQRMLQKLTASLIEDIAPLLPTGMRYGESDAVAAFNAIWTRLIMRCAVTRISNWWLRDAGAYPYLARRKYRAP